MSASKSPTPEEIAAAHKIVFDEGLRLRRQVNGAAYVDAALRDNVSDFNRPMQELVTEACWGSVWTRSGVLELKTRSLLNVGMLVALNRSTELATHVKGALTNGASEAEVREVLLQAAIYCGMPAGLEGFRVAEKVINAVREEKKGAK